MIHVMFTQLLHVASVENRGSNIPRQPHVKSEMKESGFTFLGSPIGTVNPLGPDTSLPAKNKTVRQCPDLKWILETRAFQIFDYVDAGENRHHDIA